MDWWNGRVLPRLIDVTMSGSGVGYWRRRVCAPLAGTVVEFGFGSGLNLDHYGDQVTEVLAVEPSDDAWRLAGRRIERFGRPVRRIGLDAAVLDLPDDTADAVVSTWTLCSVPQVEEALAEAQRVLRPGGGMSLVEHSLAPDSGTARWQRRLAPVWAHLAGGCQLDRDIPGLLRAGGFDGDLASRYVTRPHWAGWFVSGAVNPATGRAGPSRG